MRQGLREKCRRVTAGVLTFVMVSMLALGDAGVALASEYGERFYQDGSSVVDEDEYSDTVSTKASFKNHKENGVTISVSASDDSDFRAGGEVYLDVHVKNESSGVIEDGILNFQGRKLKDSGAYFEEEPEDAITEGIMANEREEEEEEPGAEEEELINDLAPEVSEEAPVHMESSEAEGQQSTEGAESESAAEAEAGSEIEMEPEVTAGTGIGTESEAEAGSEIGTESEAAAEGETGTEWRAEAESGEEAAAEGGSKEIAAEGEAETAARDDGDPVIKSGDAMQAVAGTAEAGAGEDKTEAATEAIPEEMSVAQENLVMQEDSSAGENEAANGPAAQESAAVESAAASPEEAGPGLQARSAVEETKGTIPAEMPAPEESRGSEDEDWFENEDGERRNEIVAGDTQKRRKSREDDEEEDDGPLQELTDIRLEPGQIYSARFVYTIDESLENAKNQKVVFRFSGKDEKNQNISQHEMFYYTANYLNAGEVRFKDGNRVRTGDEVVMGIHTSVYDFDILLGDDEVLAELASRSDAEKASPSNAQKADASNAEKASPSDAQEATPSNIEEDDIYTDPDEAEEDNEEDEEEEENDDFTVDLGNTSYKIEMINARLNGFKARKALVEDVNDNMLICTYRVSKEVKPGIYFGKIIQESKVKGKTFKSSQGFALIVTGSGEVELKGGIDGAEVQVKGPVESFPDGDVLSLKVSEVPVEKKALVEAALEQKAQETGISVNKLRALDIKVISDGEERELQGDVSVTFSNVELQPLEEFVGTAEAAAIAEEEQGVAETVAEEEEGGFSLFGMRRMSRMRAAAPEARTEGDEPADAASAEGELSNELSEAAGSQENDGETESEIAVWHLDENAGVLNDMGGSMDANGDVVMTTNHFSIYIVVNVPDVANVPVTVEHWAEVDDWTFDGNGIPLETIVNDRLYPGTPSGKTVHNKKTVKIYSDDHRTLPNGAGTGLTFEIAVKDWSKLSLGGNYKVKSVTITNSNYPDGRTVQENSADVRLELAKANNLIKIIYEPTENEEVREYAEFHDYNVSIETGEGTIKLGQVGINNRSLGDGDDRLYVGIGKNGSNGSKFDHNATGANFAGANVTPNIPQNNLSKTGATPKDWTIQFNYKDPGLFTIGDKTVKEMYRGSTTVNPYYAKKYLPNYQLGFIRKGDNYTLDIVRDDAGKVLSSDLSEIRLSYHNVSNSGTTKKLYSNLFWPMDEVEYGAKGKNRDHLFGNKSNPFGMGVNDELSGNRAVPGVENINHNWFFGMRYDVEFTIGDYIGDMNYYFRGDDDLWLFVDGKRVTDVDLGGIHSSKGAYVDFRTWMEKAENKNLFYTNGILDKTKKHTMSVFFMERGGTGSCCYMSFTLPNAAPIPSKGSAIVSKTVTKKWFDGQNAAGVRSESIVVQLQQGDNNGRNWVNYGDAVTLNAESGWTHTWDNLPQYMDIGSNTREYSYRVREISAPPYYDSVTNGFTITNTLKGNVKVTKVWDDKNNQYHTRPDNVRVQLYKQIGNGTKVAVGEPQTLNSSNQWKYEWTGLPFYQNETTRIVYSVEEIPEDWLQSDTNPDGWYTATYKWNPELNDPDYDKKLQKEFTITNKYEPEEISLEAIKIWEDSDNKYNLRPEEIQVKLFRNDAELTDQKATLSGANGWHHTWDGLPVYTYSKGSDGKVTRVRNVYRIEESTYTNDDYYETVYSQQAAENAISAQGDGAANEVKEPQTKEKYTITLTNSLLTARFRVAKRIDNIDDIQLNKNDLRDDEFIIEVKEEEGGKGFRTGLVLKHAADSDAGTVTSDKTSKYITVPVTRDGILYQVSEVDQKEYEKADTFLTLVNEDGINGEKLAEIVGSGVKVKPGADTVVIVHNVFGHEDYFHSDDSANNDFSKGVPTDSGSTQTEPVNFSALPTEKEREKTLDEEERLM